MNHSTMIHIEEGDEIDVSSGNALGAASNYGVVNIGDDVTIFPRSAETCDKLIQAFTEAREHFEHARPLGVPAIAEKEAPTDEEWDEALEVAWAKNHDPAARDAHDEERNDA